MTSIGASRSCCAAVGSRPIMAPMVSVSLTLLLAGAIVCQRAGPFRAGCWGTENRTEARPRARQRSPGIPPSARLVVSPAASAGPGILHAAPPVPDGPPIPPRPPAGPASLAGWLVRAGLVACASEKADGQQQRSGGWDVVHRSLQWRLRPGRKRYYTAWHLAQTISNPKVQWRSSAHGMYLDLRAGFSSDFPVAEASASMHRYNAAYDVWFTASNAGSPVQAPPQRVIATVVFCWFR